VSAKSPARSTGRDAPRCRTIERYFPEFERTNDQAMPNTTARGDRSSAQSLTGSSCSGHRICPERVENAQNLRQNKVTRGIKIAISSVGMLRNYPVGYGAAKDLHKRQVTETAARERQSCLGPCRGTMAFDTSSSAERTFVDAKPARVGT